MPGRLRSMLQSRTRKTEQLLNFLFKFLYVPKP